MKKLLALVLALVMTLSLCVTSNAAFSDATSINGDYKEAVEVMNAIGVLQGSDGKFNPTGTLTREQGAKIIAYMVLGTTAADALSATKAPFADVAADRWSAGAIQYCVSQGIIAGVGDNKFDPTGALTGYAFAKMALAALGYNASFEGFTGAEWQMNTAKRAITAGLTGGLTTVALSQPITREQAAQMALNTLEGVMVYYPNAMTVTTGDGTSVRTGTNSVAQPNEEEKDYRYPTVATDGVLQLCEMSFPTLKRPSDTDKFGAPAKKWTYKDAEISTYTSSPTYTFTKRTSTSSMTTALNGQTYSAASILHQNGNAGATATTAADIAVLTGNGKVVDVYTYTGVVGGVPTSCIGSVVVKEYQLFEVTSKLTSGVIFKSVSTNTYPRIEISTDKNKDFYDAVKDLAVGDYFMLAIKDGSSTDVVGTSTFTTVTGAYTGKDDSGDDTKFTIGGTVYTAAAPGTYNAAKLDTMGATTEYTVYLDANGYLVYAKANNVVTKQNAILLGTGADGDAAKGYIPTAKLLLANGKTKLAQVSRVTTGNGTTLSTLLTANDLTNYAVKSNATFTSAFRNDLITANTGVYVPVKYTENADGTVNLFDVAANGLVATGGDTATINNASATYTMGGVAGINVNSGSVLVVEDPVGTYKIYKGYKNFPSVTVSSTGGGTAAGDYYAIVSNNYAQMIFVPATAIDAAGDIVLDTGYKYIAYTAGQKSPTFTEEVDGANVYTYEVYMDGVVTEIKSKLSALPGTAGVVYIDPVFDGDNYLTGIGDVVANDLGGPTGAILASGGAGTGAGLSFSLSSGTLTVVANNWNGGATAGLPMAAGATFTVSDDFKAIVFYQNRNSSGTLTGSANAKSAYMGIGEDTATALELAQAAAGKVSGTTTEIVQAANFTDTRDQVYLTVDEDGVVNGLYLTLN